MRAFGTSSRAGHDSEGFYRRRMYAPAVAAESETESESEIAAGVLNRIYNHSSEQMPELPANSIQLMVTSPPYNVGKEYDSDLSAAEYRALLQRVFAETYRVLSPGGRACINIANVGRRPYLPVHTWIIEDMQALGYLMRGEIIWDKGASAGSSCAWGSWKSPANPVLRDVHEYILVFCKGGFSRPRPDGGQATIGRDQFLDWTKSLWRFPAASAKKAGHPAPFPLELPRRLIELYTYASDAVLDPFIGSGTTAIAAAQAGRSWVGYETSRQYADAAAARIGKEGG